MSEAPGTSASGRRLQPLVLAVERWTAVALLVLIVILTFAQVIARFVFHSPFFWTEELARYSYVWLSFIASMAVMNTRSHITVELFDSRLSRLGRLIVNCIGYAAVVIAGVLLAVGSLSTVIDRSAGHSPALGIPTSLLYGVVYLAVVVMALHALGAIGRLVADFRAGRDLEVTPAIPEGAS